MKQTLIFKATSLIFASLLALFAEEGAAFGSDVDNVVARTRSQVEVVDQVYRKHNRKFNEIARTYAKKLSEARQNRAPLPAEPVAEINKVEGELSRELFAVRDAQVKSSFAKALALHAARSKNKAAKKALAPDLAEGNSGTTLTRGAEPARPVVPPQRFSAPVNSPSITGEHVPQRLDFSKAGDSGAPAPAPSQASP
jgi:hypothetical protein